MKKLKRNRKVQTNLYYQTTDMYMEYFLLNKDSKEDNEGKNELRCWICQKNHKATDCSEIRNTAYSENINLVKSKKTVFRARIPSVIAIQKYRAELKVAKRDIIHIITHHQ